MPLDVFYLPTTLNAAIAMTTFSKVGGAPGRLLKFHLFGLMQIY